MPQVLQKNFYLHIFWEKVDSKKKQLITWRTLESEFMRLHVAHFGIEM